MFLDSKKYNGLPMYVIERLPAADEASANNAHLVSDRIENSFPEVKARFSAIPSSKESGEIKMARLMKLTGDLSSKISDLTACKNGCNHCCNISVAMTAMEAKIIGKKIGRMLAKVKKSKIVGTGVPMPFSPCTFLKEGDCSIYENRPVSCRVHFNLDSDDLLCKLVPGKDIPVPYMDSSSYLMLYVKISGNSTMGDVREFFPRADLDV